MPTEDRRKGKLLPSPVDPENTVCYTIQIPNAVPYRAAFLGQLDVLGRALTWDHPTDGTECEDCEEAAQLWRNALYLATWSDECGVSPMSCDDVADCIENDAGVQAAIASQIATSQAAQEAAWDAARFGPRMTDATAGEPLIVGPDCDLNALFGSVTAIVNQLNTNNIDFLERLEVQTNFVERAKTLLSAIPVFETLPFDEAVDFANTLQEQILENYSSEYTTGLADEYRCAIFCIAKDKPDCAFTFDDLIEYFEGRLGASFSNEQLFTDMVTYFTAGTWGGTQVVDALTLAQLAIWRWTSNWLSLSIKTFQLVGLLGANDDDPDWEILCEDCPVDDWIDNDFSTGVQYSWGIYGGGTTFAHWTGAGWERGDDTTQIAIVKTITGEVTDVEVYLDAPLSGAGGAFYAGSVGLTGLQNGTSSDQQKWVWGGIAISGGLALDLYRPGGFDVNQKVVRVRYKLTP